MVIDAVPVTCGCGNVMQIKRIGIGKRIKCPQCNAPNLVCEPVETITQPPEIKLKPDPITTTQVAVSTSRSIPPARSYVALEYTAKAFRVMGFLVGAFWGMMVVAELVMLVTFVFRGDGIGSLINSFIYFIALSIISAIVGCVFIAISELIQLAMHVQQNTYDGAYFR